MKSFTYNGVSTNDIVDKPLLIVQFDKETDINGFNREIVKGEKTLLRQETNHYGAMYSEDTHYEFYLVKNDGSPFSEVEHRKINKWLCSPRLIKPLTGIGDDGETIVYKGIFQNVGWKMITGNWDGIKCTFVCDVPFAWKKDSQAFTSSGNLDIKINIPSDDSEYIIYPKIKLNSNTKQTVKITNITDNSNSFSILLNPNLPVTINCKYCMITDATSNGIINFDDLGWSNATKIYWLKLYDGINSLSINGSCTVEFEYEYPVMRAGDFV